MNIVKYLNSKKTFKGFLFTLRATFEEPVFGKSDWVKRRIIGIDSVQLYAYMRCAKRMTKEENLNPQNMPHERIEELARECHLPIFHLETLVHIFDMRYRKCKRSRVGESIMLKHLYFDY